MKKLTTPLLATLLALSSRLAAAEPESSFGLAPSPAPQLAPASPPSSINPLMPEPVVPVEKPGKDDGRPKGDKTAIAEDRMKKQIEFRQAKVKAERDPALQAIMAKALVARTDFERRNLLVDYYNGLVDRIAKFEPTLKKEEIDALRVRYTGRFTQRAIAATVDPATFRTKRN